MADFPTLLSGNVSKLPARREKRFPARVIRFGDHGEKRWPVAAPLDGWTLNLRNLTGYELSQVRTFWRSMQGAKDKTWSITINGATLNNCVFVDDLFPMVETNGRPNAVSLELRFRQVRKN